MCSDNENRKMSDSVLTQKLLKRKFNKKKMTTPKRHQRLR